MYGIAITVAACLQAGTRADVAWLVETDGIPARDWSDAVVLTPGGGRTGSLLGGAVDDRLAELAGRWSPGRLVQIEIAEVDALISELPGPGSVHCVVLSADSMPSEVWSLAAAKEPFAVVTRLSGDEVTSIEVYSERTITGAAAPVQDAFPGTGSTRIEEGVVSVFRAVPQMVVIGASPVAEALAKVAEVVGWQAHIATEAGQATGLIAPLSEMDSVVITAHDLELAGAALASALDSRAGYIGSLGSRKMQQDRADWLAYRGITDLDRVHGPAGLDIGAAGPGQIAVAIVAEAIARHAASPSRSG